MRNKISHKPVHVKNEARLVDFGRKSIGGHAIDRAVNFNDALI